jgi:RND family efflux transporter MFP subunit
MEQKASLIEQLRIERPPATPTGAGPGRAGRTSLIIIITTVVVLAAVAIAYWRVSQADTTAVRAVTARAVGGTAGAAGSTGAASGASLLDASGYVVALRDATISAKGIYAVKQMLVQEGDTVKAGQVIARLDDSNVRAGLMQAQASAKQAAATLAQARLAAADERPIFQREQQELAQGLISQDAFDSIKASDDADQAAVQVAEQNVAVAQAAVHVSQRLEDDTVIRAPFDGVVTVTNAQPGQIVSTQFSGGGGLAEIVDMNSLEVDVDVSENYISRVHPHQPATITLDAYPDDHMPAHVIAIIPTADKSKATVQVRVAFEHRDPRVLPQMGARVSFLADSAAADASSNDAAPAATDAAVLIPADAVQTNGDGNTGTVFVIDGQVVHAHSVRLGARSNDGQLILSGLNTGALVAVGDLSKLRDGARVRVTQ